MCKGAKHLNNLIYGASYKESLRDKARHYHDCHQLLFITEGQAEITVADKKYLAKAGHIVIISRFEEHSIRIMSPLYKRYALRVCSDIAFSRSTDYLLLSVLTNRPATFSHITDLSAHREEVQALFEKLVREKTENLPLCDEVCHALFKQLLILLYRQQPALFLQEDTSAAKIVKSVQTELETHYEREHNLQTLAASFHINKYYLVHMFKKITGYAPMRYLLHCRIAATKKYLAETQIPIGDIIELCGFRDSSNFSRSFKEQTQMTPTEFRKKYGSKNNRLDPQKTLGDYFT